MTRRGRERFGAFENVEANSDAVDSNASSLVLDHTFFFGFSRYDVIEDVEGVKCISSPLQPKQNDTQASALPSCVVRSYWYLIQGI